MISKELFIESINAIQDYEKLRDELYHMGVDIDCRDNSPLNKVIDCLSKVLSESMNDEVGIDGTTIDWYLYDSYHQIWDADGIKIPMNSADDLYNFLVKCHN